MLPNQSRAIDFIKVLLTVMVVLIHCDFISKLAAPTREASEFGVILAGTTLYFLNLAVQLFFIISGYLFFRSGQINTSQFYQTKLRKRFRSIVIPYLLWNVIAMITFLAKISPWLSEYFPAYAETIWTPEKLLMGFIAIDGLPYPYDFPLWFMRNLIGVLVFTPLIGIMLNYLKAFALPAIFITLQAICLIWPPFQDYNLANAFLYFTFGAAMVRQFPDLFSPKHAMEWTATYIVTCLITAYIIPDADIWAVGALRMLIGSVSLLKICHVLSDHIIAIPTLLKSSTFFVFAFHGLFVSVASAAAWHILQPLTYLSCIVDYAMIFCILYGSSIGVAAILRKVAPRIYALLCGGR